MSFTSSLAEGVIFFEKAFFYYRSLAVFPFFTNLNFFIPHSAQVHFWQFYNQKVLHILFAFV